MDEPLPTKGANLRVATLNLWGRFAEWPARRALLEAQLPALEVDVYFLQEVVCDTRQGDQLAEVADILGYEWTVRVVAETRPYETEDEGVAIVSRLRSTRRPCGRCLRLIHRATASTPRPSGTGRRCA